MLPRFIKLLLLPAFEVCCLMSVQAAGCKSPLEETPSRVVISRDTISSVRRKQLSEQLRAITGWTSLHFDREGKLMLGEAVSASGSKSARALVEQVVCGPSAIILEDASKHEDVAFSRVVPGKLKGDKSSQPAAYVVLIDFYDFEKLTGDRRALDAFNVGWALLHEFDHIANNSEDTESLNEIGECETRINQMRRECDLPERTQYLYTRYPTSSKSDFATMYVRLPFEQLNKSGKKKRYWVVWDAMSVGLGKGKYVGPKN